MNKYFLIILISISLIVYTNSAACNTLKTDATCKAESGCSWTPATCTGNTACTSHTSTQDDCQNTKYGAVTCTWSTDTCTGGTPCSGKEEKDCAAASVAGTACTYTASSCSEKEKEGDNSKEGSDDDGSSSDSSFGLKSTILLFLAFLLF